MTYYVVIFTGPIGFIKPATAVRDEQIYSQRFLSPSTIEGMRQKLGVSSIDRARLYAERLSSAQRETNQAPTPRTRSTLSRNTSIVDRHLLVHPRLHLGFRNREDADLAATQHLCLCRNEDVVLPVQLQQMTGAEFDALPGFSFVSNEDGGVVAGFNRYTNEYDRGDIIFVGD